MELAASRDSSMEAGVQLQGVEKKAAWNVADVCRALKLFTSMEVKHHNAATTRIILVIVAECLRLLPHAPDKLHKSSFKIQWMCSGAVLRQ